jgi:hypothetical protein
VPSLKSLGINHQKSIAVIPHLLAMLNEKVSLIGSHFLQASYKLGQLIQKHFNKDYGTLLSRAVQECTEDMRNSRIP